MSDPDNGTEVKKNTNQHLSLSTTFLKEVERVQKRVVVETLLELSYNTVYILPTTHPASLHFITSKTTVFAVS